jgi:uncharacterized repeat protein (TIGR01451 family)
MAVLAASALLLTTAPVHGQATTSSILFPIAAAPPTQGGTLPNGVAWTVDRGQMIGAQYYGIGTTTAPLTQTWTFDQPVNLRFGMGHLNGNGVNECHTLPATVTPQSLAPTHTYNAATRRLCGITANTTDVSIFVTNTPVSSLTWQKDPYGAGGAASGVSFVEVTKAPPPPVAECSIALNGSFESPNIQTDAQLPGENTAYTGSYAVWRTTTYPISGWQTVSGTVDILRWYNNASNGLQSIDMFGVSAATLRQTFTGLTPGQQYTFSIDHSGHTTTQAPLLVQLGNGVGATPVTVAQLQPAANSAPGPTPPAGPHYLVTWRTFQYSFTATGPEATIQFVETAVAPASTGAFIDNFRFGSNAPCPAPLNTCTAEQTRATERYWFFGQSGAIDFGVTGTTATPFLGNSANNSEGSTVVTDSTGQLQFWSNGQTVFDRNGNAMSNGTGLLGAPSATQTVAAFPALGQPGKYFVVTNSTDVFTAGQGPNNQLYYSVVDMALNGGLGAVTTKNVALGADNTASEALVAVPNADGTRFWVITYTNGSSNIIAHEFGSSGPTGIVTTSTLPSTNGNLIGTLNFSADLTQLVAMTVSDVAPYPGLIRLLSFNAVTGQISERMSWNVGTATNTVPYSADFSPAGDYIYATNINIGGRLFRYRIAGATTGAQVKATEQDLGGTGTNDAQAGGQVRRGPDGRMYVADYGSGSISVVNTPDSATPGYVSGGFSLAPGAISRYGLPQMVTGCPLPAATDLAVTKTDNSATYTPGTSVTYQVVVTNNGPSLATGVQINDPLPPGITTANWTCSAAGGGACGAASGTGAISTTADLPVGGTVMYAVTMAVPVTFTGNLVNTATVAPPSGLSDANGTNNTASDTDTAAPRADVAITKVGPASATVGTNVAYTLTVTNNGPSIATAVSVADPTPLGLSFVSNAGACTSAFPCALGDLLPGETRTITTTFAIPVGYGSTSVANTATVSTTTPDLVSTNNVATAVTAVDISADVAVLKTVTPSTAVLVGDQVTFTISVSNNGPNTATGVVVSDVLPAGFTFVSATPSQGTYTQASGAWSIGTLAIGASPVTLDLVATVTQPGALTNTATKTAQQQPDPNTANDSAVASINAAPSADVGVTKAVDNASPSVGDLVTFVVGASNVGPSPVTSLVVTDLLPAGLTFQSATPSVGTYDSGTGAWSIGSLAVSASATLTLTAQVNTAGALVNTVTRASQTEADQNPANDQASVSLNAFPSADLQVTKGVSNPTPAIGTDVTFAVTVRNNGPSPATSVVVNDVLPAGLSFVSAVPSQGSFNAGTGVWTVGALAATQSATLTLTAHVDGPTPATLTNTATGSGAEPDPFLGNNSGSATINSQVVADLAIAKTDGLTTVVPGQPVTYTIVVSNRGPSPVSDAVVNDTFPAPLIGVTWTCTATAPSVCDTPAGAGPIAGATVDLPVGGMATFTATGTLDPTTPAGTLSNTATVAAPAGATDADPSDNIATDTSAIVPTADVQITKSGPANVVAGTTVTYSLTVTNNGPSVATAVSISDPAPSNGLTFASATAPCAAGVTPCALGDLAVGASVSFTVTFNVPGGYTTPDPITNTATVTTTATDPAPGNNTATAQTSLAAPVTDLGVTKSNGVTSVVPGTTTTYTLVVTNAGPSDATDATVTDVFDPAKFDVAGITWTCAATGAASCGITSSGGDINAVVTIAADPSGAANFVTFTVQAPVRANATGSLVNTANVTAGAGQSDPNSTNDTDTDTLTPQADVAVTKAGPPTVTPGTTVTYAIAVTNNGPSNAESVTVADPTPAGLTFVSNTGACTTAFPCALGLLAPGATQTITATYQVPAGYTTPDPLVNTTNVTSATPDLNTGNNSSSASSTIAPSADVTITKTGPPVILPGTTASYTLIVVNNGPSVAQNVVVDETIPTGLTLAGVDGPCGSFPCTISSLSVGAPVTFTVRFAVPAGYTTPNPVQNTATVTSSTPDPNTSNNTSTTSTPLGAGRADLSVEKSGPTTVAPGGAITYSLVVRNAGPSDVVDGVLMDVLPIGVTFGSLTPPASGTCTGGRTITCTGLVIPKGGSVTLAIAGTVAPDLEIGAVLTNVTTVTSPSTPDPTPDNNRDEVDSRVGAATDADVAIVKTDAADPVVVGGTVTYTLNVTNYGPATATTVTIDDAIPAGLTLNSVTGACAALPCVVPSLPAGGTATLTITATAAAPGLVTNTATVSATEPDPVSGNNSDAEPTTIAASATDADLTIAKSGPARAGVGETILYTITATNRGPGAAADVQMQDSVPVGLTMQSAAASQGTCSLTSSSIVCALGTIPVGTSVEISILASATVTGTVTNVATLTSSTPDPDPSNNTATATTEVTDPSAADLSVAKVDSPDPVVGGTPLQYVLTVSNRGPGVATGASVSDPLPAGMTAVSATANVGTCGTGPAVTCTFGDLAPGAIVTVVVATTAPATLPSPNPMLNTATATSAAADPDLANNSATSPTTVVARADVSIVKTTAQASVVPGTALTYTLTIANSGPSSAEGIIVLDPVPAGLTFASASAPCAAGFPCVLGTLAPGATVAITATYHVPSGYAVPNPIVNVATVTSTTSEADTTNNTSTVATPLAPPQADLAVVKSGPATAQRGGQVSYVLTVTNAGPSDAPNVTLNDPTPAGVTFVSASGPCVAGFPCTLGTVPVGTTTSVTVTFQVAADASGPSSISNTATVSSTATDPDPGNNTSTTTTSVIEVADLRVTKTVDNRAPAINTPVRFTVTVFNAGPSHTSGVELVDQLPAGLSFVAATPSQGTFQAATGLWTIGALSNGASVTLTLDAIVTKSGPLANVATITHTDHLDLDPSNNSSGAALNVPLASDLQVLKTANLSTASVGDTVTFTITVRNAGPDEAPAVAIEEALPAGLAFVGATASAGSYDPATGVWSVGALPNGGAATLQVQATVGAAGTLVNVARLTGTQPFDPDPSNNTSGTPLNGVGADLQVVKTADRTATAVGERVTFTIVVTNNGPGEATGVQVRESLPAGLTYVSSTASQGLYVPETGLWSVGALTAPQGGASRATLQVVADVTVAGVHRNVASIASQDQPDPTPGNDVSDVDVESDVVDLEAGLTFIGDADAVGRLFDFFVSITNRGSRATLQPLLVAIPFPRELSFEAPQTTWPCEAVGRTLFCEHPLNGPLTPDASRTLTYWANVAQVFPRGLAAYAHTVSPFDDNVRNNVGSALLTPPAHDTADLQVTQTITTSASAPGGLVVYQVEVMNLGAKSANDVTMIDVLPDGLTLESITTAAGTCAGTRRLACALDTIAPQQVVVLTIHARTTGAGLIGHTVSVSGREVDPDLTNNAARTTFVLSTASDPSRDTDGDGMIDVWESAMGLDPAANDAGADPDGDGLTNAQEATAGTHPRGFYKQFFAEGVANAFFGTAFDLLNVDVAREAAVVCALMADTGEITGVPMRLGPLGRHTGDAQEMLAGRAGAFSAVIESDRPLATDRLTTWDARAYGSGLEIGLEAPATTWFFAEGATNVFGLFYLLQNPDMTTPAEVTIRYLRPSGAPIVRTYTVAPHSRLTIPVNDVPELASTDVSAAITASRPIVAERAMYLSSAERPFDAGHVGAGATMMSTDWFFAEGATGSFFDLYLLLANPNPAPATVTVRYQLPDGTVVTKSYDVGADARRTIIVKDEDAQLAATSVAMAVTASQPIVAERSMWWPAGVWYEAHVVLGATATGPRWALAGGMVGGPRGESFYALVANQAPTAGQARVTVVFDDGTRSVRVVDVPPTSRTTLEIARLFPEAAERRVSLLIESVGVTPVPLVVEGARYSSADGRLWSAGGAMLGTRLP